MMTCQITDLPFEEQERIARILAQTERDYPEDWPFIAEFIFMDRDGEEGTWVVATVDTSQSNVYAGRKLSQLATDLGKTRRGRL